MADPVETERPENEVDDGPWDWLMIYVHAMAVVIIGGLTFLPAMFFIKTFFYNFYQANLAFIEKVPNGHGTLCCWILTGLLLWIPIYFYIRRKYFDKK